MSAEEQMMTGRFGDAYRQYMRVTGRFYREAEAVFAGKVVALPIVGSTIEGNVEDAKGGSGR